MGAALLVGWAPYLRRSVSLAQFHWGAISLGAACFVVLVAGTHRFLKWLFSEMNRNQTVPQPSGSLNWRAADTARAFALLFLAFVSGMMVIGFAHQTAWLALAPRPIVHQRPREAARWAMGTLSIIGESLSVYASTHGNRYPDDVAKLANPEFEHMSWPDRFLYFGKGQIPGDAAAVIGIDPPINHQDAGMVVLFGDGRAAWIDIDKAGDILLQHGFERVDSSQTWNSPKYGANP
jgi:hypothetical protein